MNPDEIKEDLVELQARKKTGPKSAVTRESVYAACELLNKEGRSPAYESVREMLGCGSRTTINPALRDWKATNGMSTSAVPIPSQVGKAIHDHIAEVVDKFAKNLRDELDQANEMCIGLERELTSTEEERDAALNDCDAIRSQLDKTSGKCQQIEEESLKKDQQIKDLLREITEAKSNSSRADADRDRAERALENSDSKQTATMQLLGNQLIEVRKERDNFDGKLKQLETDLAEKKASLEQIQKKLQESEISLATAEKERELIYGRSMESDAKLSASLSERDKLQKDLAQQVNEIADLRRQVNESIEKHRISDARFRALSKRYGVHETDDDSVPF